jgi:hypothetical protein
VQSTLARPGEDGFLSVDDLLRHSQRLFLAFNQAGANGLSREVNGLLSELCQKQEFQLAALALYNPDKKNAAVLSKSGDAPNFREIPIPASLEMTAVPCAIEVHDAASETRFPDLAQTMKASGFHSFRIVTVSTQGYATGVLILGRKNPGEFAAEHVMRSNETAQRVALMLENSLITDLLLNHQARLSTLFDVNTVLASAANIQEIFEQVSSTVRRVVTGDYTCLAVMTSLLTR